MVGRAPEMYFFLLQDMKYFKDDDPRGALIIGIVIAAIILFSVVFHIIRNAGAASIAGKSGSVTPRKFNAFTLRRISSAYGLDRDQTRLLEYVFRNDAVNDPERVMQNPTLLDRHFKRAYRTIERNSETEEDAQQRLVRLFSLRNVIEAAPGFGGAPQPAQLAENTAAVLGSGRENYPVRVVSSRGQNVITEIPRNALGTPVRLPKGSRVTLSFFTKSSKGFSFDGHVFALVETPHGPGLHITHGGKIKPLAKRKYRRRQASVKCELYFVFLENVGAGRKKTAKLVVDKKRYAGTVLDISIGGCSIKTTAPIQIGSRLKISIDYDDNYLINVLGQVLRANRSGAAGTIIHVKFLKIPRRAFNSINALVFGYNEE